MSHVVEVDLSGRIEMTNGDTALAFANGISSSILIQSTVKQDCIRILRRRGFIGPVLYNQFFAIGLFFLLKDHIDNLSSIILDYEYQGRENKIKEYLINLLRRGNYIISTDQIQYLHIGKNSPAHELALKTFRGEEKPNKKLKVEEVIGEFRI